jgi:hypothetical protein
MWDLLFLRSREGKNDGHVTQLTQVGFSY